MPYEFDHTLPRTDGRRVPTDAGQRTKPRPHVLAEGERGDAGKVIVDDGGAYKTLPKEELPD